MASFCLTPPDGEMKLEALDDATLVASCPVAQTRTINAFSDITQINQEMDGAQRLTAVLRHVSEFLIKNADWCRGAAEALPFQMEMARSPTALRNVIGFAANDEAGKLQVAKALLRDRPLDIGEPAGRYLAHITGETFKQSSNGVDDINGRAELTENQAYYIVRRALDNPSILERIANDPVLVSTLLDKIAELIGGTPRGYKVAADLFQSQMLSAATDYSKKNGIDLDGALVLTAMHSELAKQEIGHDDLFDEALRRSARLRQRVAARPDITALVLKPFTPVYQAAEPRRPARKPSSSPTFSVVLAVYNGEEFLGEAIASVLAQTFEDFELLVIDDCSTDQTGAIAASYAATDDRVHVVRNRVNGGQSVSFNNGIALCRAEHVAFIDADDLWFPDKLARVKAYIETGDRFSFLQHNLMLMFKDVPSQRTFRTTLAAGDYIAAMMESGAPLPGPFTPTSGTVFPRAILRTIGPIPPELRVCSDGFLTRAAAALGPVASLASSLGYYRLHGDNATIGNDDYDGSSYVSRVLMPMLTKYYNDNNYPIKLPTYQDSRVTFADVAVPGTRLQTPSDLDVDFARVWTYATTGFGVLKDFSPSFVRFLVSVQAVSSEGNYGDLGKNVLGPKVFDDREQALYLMLDCYVRFLSSDNKGAGMRLDRMPASVRASVSAQTLTARLLKRVGQREENLALLNARLRSGSIIGEDTDNVADAFSRQEAGIGPAAFLQTQQAVIALEGYDTGYFKNRTWVQERIDVVCGYERRNYKTGGTYRGFAVRERLLSSDERLQALPGAPDWSEAKLLDLPGATVLTGEWMIRSLDGVCLSDLYIGTPHHRASSYGSVTQARNDYVLLYPKEPALSLEAAFLAGGDRNYYHWVLDVLPRLFSYRNVAGHEGFHLVTGAIDRPFQTAILAATGIRPEEVTQVPYPSTFRADRLIVPLMGPPNRTSTPVYSTVSRFIHDTVARAVMPAYKTEPWAGAGQRVFVLRGAARHRSVINETEVAKVLQGRGWRIVDPAALSFAEQIAALNEASHVVAAHGAGLANLAFCRPGTRVIELAFPRWSPPYFEAISIGRGLSHTILHMREVQSLARLPKFNDGFVSQALLTRIQQFGAE